MPQATEPVPNVRYTYWCESCGTRGDAQTHDNCKAVMPKSLYLAVEPKDDEFVVTGHYEGKNLWVTLPAVAFDNFADAFAAAQHFMVQAGVRVNTATDLAAVARARELNNGLDGDDQEAADAKSVGADVRLEDDPDAVVPGFGTVHINVPPSALRLVLGGIGQTIKEAFDRAWDDLNAEVADQPQDGTNDR